MLKLELCRIGKEQIRFNGVVIGDLELDHMKVNIDVDHDVLENVNLDELAYQVARAYFEKHTLNTFTVCNEKLYFEFLSYKDENMEWLTVKELTLTITPEGDILWLLI